MGSFLTARIRRKWDLGREEGGEMNESDQDWSSFGNSSRENTRGGEEEYYMGATWVDEAARKIVLMLWKGCLLFAGREIIMVIFHHASVCPDHFPFNEKLFSSFCFNRSGFWLSKDTWSGRILCESFLSYWIFFLEKSFTKKDLFLYSLCVNLRKKILSNRNSHGYWKILSGIIERCRWRNSDIEDRWQDNCQVAGKKM